MDANFKSIIEGDKDNKQLIEESLEIAKKNSLNEGEIMKYLNYSIEKINNTKNITYSWPDKYKNIIVSIPKDRQIITVDREILDNESNAIGRYKYAEVGDKEIYDFYKLGEVKSTRITVFKNKNINIEEIDKSFIDVANGGGIEVISSFKQLAKKNTGDVKITEYSLNKEGHNVILNGEKSISKVTTTEPTGEVKIIEYSLDKNKHHIKTEEGKIIVSKMTTINKKGVETITEYLLDRKGKSINGNDIKSISKVTTTEPTGEVKIIEYFLDRNKHHIKTEGGEIVVSKMTTINKEEVKTVIEYSLNGEGHNVMLNGEKSILKVITTKDGVETTTKYFLNEEGQNIMVNKNKLRLFEHSSVDGKNDYNIYRLDDSGKEVLDRIVRFRSGVETREYYYSDDNDNQVLECEIDINLEGESNVSGYNIRINGEEIVLDKNLNILQGSFTPAVENYIQNKIIQLLNVDSGAYGYLEIIFFSYISRDMKKQGELSGGGVEAHSTTLVKLKDGEYLISPNSMDEDDKTKENVIFLDLDVQGYSGSCWFHNMFLMKVLTLKFQDEKMNSQEFMDFINSGELRKAVLEEEMEFLKPFHKQLKPSVFHERNYEAKASLSEEEITLRMKTDLVEDDEELILKVKAWLLEHEMKEEVLKNLTLRMISIDGLNPMISIDGLNSRTEQNGTIIEWGTSTTYGDKIIPISFTVKKVSSDSKETSANTEMLPEVLDNASNSLETDFNCVKTGSHIPNAIEIQ